MAEVFLIDMPLADNRPPMSSGQGPRVFVLTAMTHNDQTTTAGRKAGKPKGSKRALSSDGIMSSKTFIKVNVEPKFVLVIRSGFHSCAKYCLQAFPRCKSTHIDILLRKHASSALPPEFESHNKYHCFDVNGINIEELKQELWDIERDCGIFRGGRLDFNFGLRLARRPLKIQTTELQ